MKVELKCFGRLVDPQKCDFRDSTTYKLKTGQTLADLIQMAGLDDGNIRVAFVNDQVVGLTTVLSDGDHVGLAPSVGGL